MKNFIKNLFSVSELPLSTKTSYFCLLFCIVILIALYVQGDNAYKECVAQGNNAQQCEILRQ